MSNSKRTNAIGLKEVLNTLTLYFHLLLKGWLVILVVGLLGGGIGLIYSVVSSTKYVASTTFTVEQSGGGSAFSSYISAFAGNFGLGGGQVLDVDVLMNIISSRRIIGASLLTYGELEYIYDNEEVVKKNDLLANHFIELYGFHDKWKDIEELKSFNFTRMHMDSLELIENSALSQLRNFLVNDLLVVNKSFEGIISIDLTTENEDLSQQINVAILDNIEKYYIRNSTEKEKFTVANLTNRLDSIQHELGKAEDALSRFMDRHITTVKSKGRKDQVRLTRDVQILTVMYVEIVKNLELAKFNLISKTPILQVIDGPIKPLKRLSTSKVVAIAIGGILAGIFICAFICIRYAVNQALAREQN